MLLCPSAPVCWSQQLRPTYGKASWKSIQFHFGVPRLKIRHTTGCGRLYGIGDQCKLEVMLHVSYAKAGLIAPISSSFALSATLQVPTNCCSRLQFLADPRIRFCCTSCVICHVSRISVWGLMGTYSIDRFMPRHALNNGAEPIWRGLRQLTPLTLASKFVRLSARRVA